MAKRPAPKEFFDSSPGCCEVCGKPLDAPYWITNHPHGVHEACRDWTRVAFPFGDRVRRLWWLVRGLQQSYWRAVRIGRWMRAAQGRWPNDALAVVRAQRRLWAELDHELDELKKRLK